MCVWACGCVGKGLNVLRCVCFKDGCMCNWVYVCMCVCMCCRLRTCVLA